MKLLPLTINLILNPIEDLDESVELWVSCLIRPFFVSVELEELFLKLLLGVLNVARLNGSFVRFHEVVQAEAISFLANFRDDPHHDILQSVLAV